MITIKLIIPVAIFFYGTAAAFHNKSEPIQTEKTINVMDTIPKKKVLACRLTSPELQKRKKEVIAVLKASVLETEELDNGFRYRFKGSDRMIDELISFIKTERQCCDFFSFNISIGNTGGDAWLEITGEEGVKEFIDTLI